MNLKFALVTLVISVALSQHAYALKSDSDQPAHIEADETEIDFKTGVRTLTNNVIVIQGTLRLKADKLVAKYNKAGQLENAVADGSLARFKQRPDGKPDDVEGWAKKITVNYPTNEIILVGKAALKQGASVAEGKKIIYNMATDKLKIVGNSVAKVAGKDGQSVPKREVDEAFKDDKTSAATKSEPETIKQSIEPAKAGRSRLILQPKKKVKAEPKQDPKNDEGE